MNIQMLISKMRMVYKLDDMVGVSFVERLLTCIAQTPFTQCALRNASVSIA